MLRSKAADSGSGRQYAYERRRSPRREIQIPVRVRWIADDGSRREEVTKTQVVNAHGCLLLLRAALWVGTEVELVNLSSQAVRRGKVAWGGEVSSDGRNKVGIELDEPDPHFWGPQYEDTLLLTIDRDWWC